MLLVVADENAPRLVATGRWRFWGELRHVGLSGQVARGGWVGGVEFARAVGSGSPRREWGVEDRHQCVCSLRTLTVMLKAHRSVSSR